MIAVLHDTGSSHEREIPNSRESCAASTYYAGALSESGVNELNSQQALHTHTLPDSIPLAALRQGIENLQKAKERAMDGYDKDICDLMLAVEVRDKRVVAVRRFF